MPDPVEWSLPVVFHFSVKVDNSEIAFSEVSGLETSIEVSKPETSLKAISELSTFTEKWNTTGSDHSTGSGIRILSY